VPVGRLADRVGRAPVFVFGYALLLVVYALVVLPLGGDPVQLICLVILGAHYAATDGVLMALTSAAVPPASRASGLALLTSATGVSRLVASVVFGAAWTWWGMDSSLRFFGAGLLAALGVAVVSLARSRKDREHEPLAAA
jgi:MFS family permease